MEMTLWIQMQAVMVLISAISGTGFLGFHIKKAFNEWITQPSLDGWVRGES